jgi:osmotically-inducible protein OsmY
MTLTQRAALCVAAIFFVVGAAACGDDEGQVLTDTSAAGGAVAAPAATAQAGEAEDRVEKALDADTTLRAFGLDADDDDNRIVLKGRVRTEELKTVAAQVATREAGGLQIDNRIRVDARAGGRAAQPRDVDDIEEQVEDALEADSTLKSYDLEVDEDDGQIVLEGTVRSAQHRTLAEQLARRLAGTVTVVNRVKVQQ